VNTISSRAMRVLGAVALTSVSLLGCGGGGDDSAGTPAVSTPVVTTPTFDAAAAFRNTLTTSQTWTTTRTQNSNTDSVVLTLAPAGSGNFNGSTYTKSHQKATLQVSVIPLGLAEADIFFDPTTYAVQGSQNTTADGDCTVATSATTLPPTNASVGDSGPLYTEDKRAGCGNTVTSRITTTWSVEADQGVDLFCLNTVETNTVGTVLTTGATCFEIDTAGTLGSRARVSFGTPSTTTVVTRNY
jgi:hypothetical protein